MIDIYIVESPLQLKSAISYNVESKNCNNVLILKKDNNAMSNENYQIDSILKNSKWKKIHILKKFKSKTFNIIYMFILSFYFAICYHNRVDKILIGDYRNFFFIFIARLINYKEEILLDDGTIIIDLQYKYFRRSMIYEDFCSLPKKNILKIISNGEKQVPNLYSVFNLSCWHSTNQVNYMSEVKKDIVTKKKEIYFFGSKYSECGLIKVDEEIRLLSDIYFYFESNYEATSIIYIPHREDSNKKKVEITKIGFILKELDLPAELYFEKLNVHPYLISGFYTTVLYSLNRSYKFDSVVSFSLCDYINNESDKETAKLIYNFYKNTGIEVVSLKKTGVIK